jgi:hypothetical protein
VAAPIVWTPHSSPPRLTTLPWSLATPADARPPATTIGTTPADEIAGGRSALAEARCTLTTVVTAPARGGSSAAASVP